MPRPAPRPPAPPAEDDGPTSEAASRARALRGAAKLASDVSAGLADLVEAVQGRIAGLHGQPGAADAGTRGIAGLVGKTVRGVQRAGGGSVDTLLLALSPMLAANPEGPPASLPEPEREALLAALNGVLGDELANTANPLAIRMAWRHAGRALPMKREALAAALPAATGRPLVLVHGLCMNDLQWRLSNGHDHGAALGQALGFTPIYLHYDSGLHVSTNGRALAGRLEQLLAQWPHPIERFAIVAHGMGGLLARSALHYGRGAGHHWPHRLDDLACLGTPHHGAPGELDGPGLEALLAATPYADPLAHLARRRSAGITDLGHGNLVDEDWTAGQRAKGAIDRRQAVPLPAGPRHYALAGMLAGAEGEWQGKLPGDGLVPVASALGKHRLARRTLKYLPGHQRVFEQVGHLELLSDPAVFEQLARWLG